MILQSKPVAKMWRIARLVVSLLVAVTALLLIWIVMVQYAPPQLLYRNEIHRTEEAIGELEKYKAEHGVYPPESQFPLKKADMFYMPTDYGYRIGFSVGFDESYWYNSRTRKWSFENNSE